MIWALIPAFNETDTVAATVRAVSGVPGVDTVLVVDDGSTDDTAAQASQAGAQVLALPVNGGKGAALEAGFALMPPEAEVILLLDADLGATASQAELLLEPVIAGDADMTVASFPRPPGKAGFGLVKGLARWGIQRLGGDFDAGAPLSGQRALSRRATTVIGPLARGYGVEVALTIRVLRAGMSVREVPTSMTHAHTGRDVAGFVHRGGQFLDVTRALLRIWIEARQR